ncbi:MAG: nucleotidyltransferase domain-containing protein [Dysgonamonadaceae bacterium]|jgi:predicted nucleotidyltransferase|nr:nucleotidyltransferase domain-containing protein [Dysgonamonadaceae bacterium]
MFGLSKRDIETIYDILEKYSDIHSVYLFGSRAKGTYRQGSDIDLAIINNQLSLNQIIQLKDDFENSSLPYFVDIVDYTAIKDPLLKKSIRQFGKEIYSISNFCAIATAVQRTLR